jgi:hypothetical protein
MGDETKASLQRLYGTAFESKEELEAHFVRLEEAKKRDHRKLGKELKLFHIDEDVGQGLILWTPNGAILRQELQNFISEELRKQGYNQVFTPHIGKLALYKTSGHFPYYKDSQFAAIVENDDLAKVIHEGCGCGEVMARLGGISAKLRQQLNVTDTRRADWTHDVGNIRTEHCGNSCHPPLHLLDIHDVGLSESCVWLRPPRVGNLDHQHGLRHPIGSTSERRSVGGRYRGCG